MFYKLSYALYESWSQKLKTYKKYAFTFKKEFIFIFFAPSDLQA